MGPLQSRSPTHKAHPDTSGDEFNDSEIIEVMLFEAGCHWSEMLDLAKESFDEFAVAVKEWAEGRAVHASWRWLDVGPSATLGKGFTMSVSVVGPISE